MAEIGSTVIYMGVQWNNQVHGTQPVWGVKKSSSDDEQISNQTKNDRKTFAELLDEAIEKQREK